MMKKQHLINIYSAIQGRIRRIFTLDLRALSIFRMGLAVIILWDLSMGATHLTAFFTNEGILPTDLLLNNFFYENLWSFHSLSGTYERQLTLLILNYCIAICLLFGRKTRLMQVLAWMFFCSLSARNPIINSGADAVMRHLLFWAMFLPTHIRRSVDTRKQPKPQTTEFLSRATVGLVIHMASIYVRNYTLKTHPQRKVDFTALYTALSIDMFRTSFGTFIYQYPQLMQRLTRGVIYLEGFGILLFLVPRKQKRWRTTAVSMFIMFHLGIAATMKLGHFPRTCIIGWIALYPSVVWNTLFPKHISDISSGGPIPRNRSYGLSVFLICCILYGTMRNLRTTNFNKRESYFPVSLNKYGFLFRLDQYWSMFSPYPLEDDGWFVISGKTATGEKINLFTPGDPVSYEKPVDFGKLYPNEKWRKVFLNYRQGDYAVYRPVYLQRQCRTRNTTHPHQKITSASMEFVREQTLPNYQVEDTEIIMLATQPCS